MGPYKKCMSLRLGGEGFFETDVLENSENYRFVMSIEATPTIFETDVLKNRTSQNLQDT